MNIASTLACYVLVVGCGKLKILRIGALLVCGLSRVLQLAFHMEVLHYCTSSHLQGYSGFVIVAYGYSNGICRKRKGNLSELTAKGGFVLIDLQ